MRRLLLVVLLAVLAAALVPLGVAAAAPLDSVQVSGNSGEKPVVTVSAPVSVKSSTSSLLSAGSGEVAQKGASVSIDYVIINGRDGTELESSYGVAPASIVLDAKQSLPVLVKSLTGSRVGDRRIVAIAPKEGVTKSAPAASGVKKNDTLLFVVEVKSTEVPAAALERAEGTAVEPVAGLPTVSLSKSGEPTVKIPSGDAPSTLVVQPLIKGAGPTVQAGQTVTVHYRGVLWRTGKTFDSSWARGASVDFPIGVGQVVAGWDEGLVGQTVGSQLLLVVPPDKGYGSSGNSQAGIKGTDTMVFVVDILKAE